MRKPFESSVFLEPVVMCFSQNFPHRQFIDQCRKMKSVEKSYPECDTSEVPSPSAKL